MTAETNTKEIRQCGRMSNEKLEQGSGAPSFCWHCSKRLQRAKGKGKGLGLFYFRTVVDQDGVLHRVHGDCVARVIGGGVTLANGQKVAAEIKEALK